MFDAFECRAKVVPVSWLVRMFCRVLNELKVILERLGGIRSNMIRLPWYIAWRWSCRRCTIDGCDGTPFVLTVSLRVATHAHTHTHFGYIRMLLMAALCNRAGHIYFHPVVSSFFLSSFLFPSLISAVGDWMSTILPHMVCP